MALTITPSEVDGWAAVAQNAIGESSSIDLSGSYDSWLHLDIGLTSATAHTGTRVIVQVASHASTDGYWVDYWAPIVCVGTANSEAITNAPASVGTTVFTVASTTGYEADGALWVLLKDSASDANSELFLMVSHSSNTSVTMQDASVIEHAATSTLYNIAESRVIHLPMGVLRARVIYDNTYDADGSTILARTRAIKTTAVS